MKTLLLLFGLLLCLGTAQAQTITAVIPNRESQLYFRGPTNNGYYDSIKVAIPGANMPVDTLRTSFNEWWWWWGLGSPTLNARASFNNVLGYYQWQSVHGSRSALPYTQNWMLARVLHPDTVVVFFQYFSHLKGTRDLEIRTRDGRRFFKDSAFTFDGFKEPTAGFVYHGRTDNVTLHGLEGYPGQTLDIEITGVGTTFTQASPLYASYGAAPNELIVDFHNDTTINTVHGATAFSPTRMVATISIPANTPPGLYDYTLVTTRDGYKYVNNGFRVLAGAVSEPGHIRGRLFYDTNANCLADLGEKGIVGRPIIAQPGNYIGITDSAGHYDIQVPFGTYTVNRRYRNGWLPACLPAGRAGIVVTSALSLRDSVDFADTTDLYSDLSVYGYPGNARPGFWVNYWATVRNEGDLASTGRLRFVADTLLDSVRVQYPVGTVSGDTALWSFNLAPRQGMEVMVQAKVPADVSLLGRFLHSKFEILNAVRDSNSFNNVSVLMHEIRGSFDPNDKAVEPAGGLTEADSVLTYTIRFQNTGTDTAFTVVVRDTLSHTLDVASIKTLVASHPYSFKLKGTRNAEWRFDNILLVDSNRNEEASHGLVKFSINRKKGLSIGTPISNQAHIYFDFNPAVATNLVQNSIVSVREIIQKSSENSNTLCRIVPNPVQGKGRVVLLGEAAHGQAILTVTDALGKIIYKKMGLSGKDFTFGDALTPGVYLIRVSEHGSTLAKGRFVAE